MSLYARFTSEKFPERDRRFGLGFVNRDAMDAIVASRSFIAFIPAEAHTVRPGMAMKALGELDTMLEEIPQQQENWAGFRQALLQLRDGWFDRLMFF